MVSGLWIPIVLFAAAAQTGRNAAQRSLTSTVGTMPATLVRFLFGLPLALLFLGLIYLVPATTPSLPDFTPKYVVWIAIGAAFQIAATAALLLAMETRNFAVAVTLSKTEVLQIALFSTIFLAETPTALDLLAICLASAGLILMSIPAGSQRFQLSAWASKSAMYGLLCGFCFAVAIIGFRGAAVEIADTPALVSGAWGVTIAQTLQSVFLGGWLLYKEPAKVTTIFKSWRVSVIAGSLGALASLAWFTAYALQDAASVRTVGMVEVLFSYLISRKVFRESIRFSETFGILLVVFGLVLICITQ